MLDPVIGYGDTGYTLLGASGLQWSRGLSEGYNYDLYPTLNPDTGAGVWAAWT